MVNEKDDDFVPDLIIFSSGCVLPNSSLAGIGIVFARGEQCMRRSMRINSQLVTKKYIRILAVVIALESIKPGCKVVVYSENNNDFEKGMKKEMGFWKSRRGKKKIAENPTAKVESHLCERFHKLVVKHDVRFAFMSKKIAKGENKKHVSACRGMALARAKGWNCGKDKEEW